MGFDMKEYLRKNSNGSYSYIGYVHADHVSDSMIEIPEGDTWAYKNSRGNIITMYGNVCQAFIGDLVWERESMKENKITKDYLEKQADGSYVMKSGFSFKDAGWIEIPEGADIAACNQLSKKITFFKDSGYSQLDEGKWHKCGIEVDGIKYHDIGEFLSFGNGAQILWRRESPNDKLASAEQYRQAEVLPFIDDEPENVDLASGCDLDELAKEHGYRDRDIGESCVSYRESLKVFIAFRKSRGWDFVELNIKQDNVNNPSHYADSVIECIDAMQAMLTPEQFIGYLRGNIFKYQWRYEKKNGVEDLKKSQWYLDKLISVL